MTNPRPDVNDEDIGMRAFALRRASAVERAVERIRHALGHRWDHFTTHEIEELEWVLGEMWSYVAREEWDELRFGHLTLDDLRQIIAHGREIREHTRNTVDALNDVRAIVTSKS
ncbi:MAG: hypothetical protein FDZ70_06265 [Actinobacteria bacterium]|nr:MAG: hypothetical protein FDZ70_06265 [Actinomycetota bacterium]